ncbi:hypothetical protein PIROE2DRAFT_14057 [Piromyces sp. E2]|nr:hypothetical protein PIROE2DRAFT_14057 [Piromyces sp. E2]|eukprot:OUM60240.1 hypothetical protein PIROE2DRAFT_14057 [Piromyces sp. E2]
MIDSRQVNSSENSGNISGNNSMYNRSSINRSNRKCSNVFNFLLGGRRNNNRNQIEWGKICVNTKLKSGSLSDIPFLTKTAAFFNKVMPIILFLASQRWSVINRYSTKVTKERQC